MTRALIADDEPLLRERLAAQLALAWPELEVVAQARNGREAVELFDELQPDIVFLDVHMPGMNGVDAARAIDRRALVVFVTAFEQYAVQAFEQGALDYLVKPFEPERLADTVARLQQRLRSDTPAPSQGASPDADAPLELAPDALELLAQELARRKPARAWLQWIKASSGNTVRLIPVDEIIFLRSDEKYTLVVWAAGEAVIRKTIRELADELDPMRFVQTHRSVIVNLHHVSHVVRGANETADVHLRARKEVLPVSRSWLHVFKQM
jgi:DNA-binding LytR/AlgR family response regulator